VLALLRVRQLTKVGEVTGTYGADGFDGWTLDYVWTKGL